MKNSKIARITVGYVVASLMLFSTVMPASAADMQFRENIGTGVSIDEEVQEDFLGPRHPELSDEAAAPVTDTGNGGTVLVMPRSDLDEPVSMDQNEVVEDAVTVEDEAADEDEEIECDPEEVDKSELEAAIAAAGELDEADYTAETWGVFASAMEAAEAVMEDEEATQEEVDNALAELNSAVDALEEVVVEVDKSELEAAIAAAGELDEADYTAETWGVFASALEAAEAVMEDEEATQEEVDNALAELNSAVDALEEVVVEVDKSELEAAIAAAGELDEADYTEKSWSKLEKALAAAETVMEDEEATQEEVDNALAELNSAVDALEEVVVEVDKSELEAAIAAAGELNEADYTEKSWSKLEKALAAAETVMEDDQATQKMVDKALAKLNKAMEKLEEVEEEEEESIQIELYKELLEAFEKMQSTYNRLLDMFDSIFGN
ncbi:MAG: hypothetical protein PHS69_07095 [Firmicutes bacterium]|nr:hypothetical protein [Bacillota bacterium]